MKKRVTVIKTTEMEIEIEIDEELISEKGVALFKEHMWDIEDETGIIEHVAFHVMKGNEGYCLDFIGLLGQEGKVYGEETPNTTYKIIDQYTDYDYQHN